MMPIERRRGRKIVLSRCATRNRMHKASAGEDWMRDWKIFEMKSFRIVFIVRTRNDFRC
jgi:hypothetical protein